MKRLIIKIRWGGMGDHLFHSPLPRLAKQKHGYDEVFISNHSQYNNPNTKRLVWELNPFVDGFNNEDHDYPRFGAVPVGKNMLDAVVDFYGLSDEERFREPEIYYKPKNIAELNDAVLFEQNHGNNYGIPTQEQIEKYFVTNNINRTHQMATFHRARCGRSYPAEGLRVVTAKDQESLCDVIHSCKEFYCLMSGVATLSAALGKPTTVLYVEGILPMFRHSKLHNYVRL